ncbi:hypothetical protein CDD83_1650 [Cordyceps sp. RAO-2017]|nr:hypothetical protein CDD83_1650 [Cordyceps sp. RAO-2017]
MRGLILLGIAALSGSVYAFESGPEIGPHSSSAGSQVTGESIEAARPTSLAEKSSMTTWQANATSVVDSTKTSRVSANPTPTQVREDIITQTDITRFIEACNKECKYEITAGYFVISALPKGHERVAAAVSLRLVQRIVGKTEFEFKFEACEAHEQNRVVTFVAGRYVFGHTLKVFQTAGSVTSAGSLLCVSAGRYSRVSFGVQQFEIEDVESTEFAAEARLNGRCSGGACELVQCRGDACNRNLRIETEAVSGHVSVHVSFQTCQASGPDQCWFVETCTGKNCVTQMPARGTANPPIESTNIQILTAADVSRAIAQIEKPAGSQGKPGRTVQGSVEIIVNIIDGFEQHERKKMPTAVSSGPVRPASSTRPPTPGRSDGPFPIIGVQIKPGKPVPARRDINDLFEERGPEWDLYVLALIAMQDADSADPLSWFQIAAIHGRPALEWNNTGPGIVGNDAGYCFHKQSLFLHWHRPYMLLFEVSPVLAVDVYRRNLG